MVIVGGTFHTDSAGSAATLMRLAIVAGAATANGVPRFCILTGGAANTADGPLNSALLTRLALTLVAIVMMLIVRLVLRMRIATSFAMRTVQIDYAESRQNTIQFDIVL